MERKIVRLIECIAGTWQGEGCDVGRRVLLLRFKQCNRICSFCDTIVKMRVLQEAEYKLEDLQKLINEERVSILVSGGEPTFEPHFEDTLLLLNELDYSLCDLETNGFALLDLIEKVDLTKNVHYMYSPKIFTESELQEEIRRTEKLKKYEQVFVKVVYEYRSLVSRYLEFLSKLDINQRVFLMPEGDTREKLIEHSGKVFDACEKYKFNFSTRSHIIYGFV